MDKIELLEDHYRFEVHEWEAIFRAVIESEDNPDGRAGPAS